MTKIDGNPKRMSSMSLKFVTQLKKSVNEIYFITFFIQTVDQF